MKGAIIFQSAEIPLEIFKSTRSKHIVRIKAMIIAYMYDELRYPYLAIARTFEMDHTSIIHLYRQAQELKDDYPYLQEWYNHFDLRYQEKLYKDIRNEKDS